MRHLLFPLALAVLVSAPGLSLAQSVGSGIPAYQPPAKAEPPSRRPASTDTKPNDFDPRPEVVDNFRGAYGKKGKPKLALFYNRQFTDTLTEWYSDTRIVQSTDNKNTMEGDITLNSSGNNQSTMEIQQRNKDLRRTPQTEPWEWEFQDGFLGPFLEAGATILDRATIIRTTALDATTTNPIAVETQALQGKADYLMEALVTSSAESRTKYELRVRIIDVQTGAIVAYVNSRGLKEWNPKKRYTADEHGFSDDDPDDELVGPYNDTKFKADSTGIHHRRKPPKLRLVSQNLAYNVMTRLTGQWQ